MNSMFIYKLFLFQIIPLFQIFNIIFLNIFYISNNLLYWGKTMKKYFKWNQYVIPDSNQFYSKACIYFLNHRESIDFAIDAYTTSGNAVFLSRYLVLFSAPLMGLCTIITNTVFYFKRSKNLDKNAFINWSNKKLNKSPYKSLNIYPEGTRRLNNDVSRIKDGGILYSYQYNVPIQIIITKNKENVLSLKNYSHHDYVNLYTYFAKEIYPRDFETFEKYRDFVCSDWERCWDIVYNKEYKQENCEIFEPKKINIEFKNKNRVYLLRFLISLIIIYYFS